MRPAMASEPAGTRVRGVAGAASRGPPAGRPGRQSRAGSRACTALNSVAVRRSITASRARPQWRRRPGRSGPARRRSTPAAPSAGRWRRPRGRRGRGQQVGGEARRVDEVRVEMHGDRAEGGHPLDHAGDGAIGQGRGKAEHPGVDLGAMPPPNSTLKAASPSASGRGKPAAGRPQGLLPQRPRPFLAGRRRPAGSCGSPALPRRSSGTGRRGPCGSRSSRSSARRRRAQAAGLAGDPVVPSPGPACRWWP